MQARKRRNGEIRSGTGSMPVPIPPEEMIFRVSLTDAESFDLIGRESRNSICQALGPDWTWQGKRVLDFGCGVGRTLRHLTEEAEVAQIEGCDVHGESIAWCREHLEPPFHFFLNSREPRLTGIADETYDLVIAVSVFTHLATRWSEWISELQRVTRPGGILVATFHGPGTADTHELHSGIPYVEEETGMTCLPTGDEGTFLSVFHSRWWLENHWGRAFEPRSISPDGFGAQPGVGQGVFVGSRRDERVSPEELREAGAADPREVVALQRANSILLEVSQRLRKRKLSEAAVERARGFVLSNPLAQRMFMRSRIQIDRIRRLGPAHRRRD